MCSRFRGSCASDVKSAVHPEPGFPISLSVFTAALCAPGETQKKPAGDTKESGCPEHPGTPARTPALKQRAYPNPGKNRDGVMTGQKGTKNGMQFLHPVMP